MDYEGFAVEKLGLEWQESERLFYTEEWPEQFGEFYDRASDKEKQAELAAARIDHFIATKGKE